MPLAKGLSTVLLSHPCPHCGHTHTKKGSYYQTVAHYKCTSCCRDVRMTYDLKLRLFDANAHRAI